MGWVAAMEVFWRHGIEFVRVPSGSFEMGVGFQEEREARALSPEPRIWWEAVRPTTRTAVEGFAVSASPIANADLERLTGRVASDGRPADEVARVSRSEAAEIAALIGGRLPSEVEWEYACRGGTQGLFAFGELPENEQALAPWMTWRAGGGPPNGFGLHALYTGEWCSDTWRLRHFDFTTETPGVWVVRGGGAYFWPWQDEEWVWCMSAMRSPSSEVPDDEMAFRVVIT